MSGTQNASTVRNRTMRVGETVVRQSPSADMAKPVGPVVVGLDGGYVRNPDCRVRGARVQFKRSRMTASPQHQGSNLIPGKVKPLTGCRL
jgi:hypothetical protein